MTHTPGLTTSTSASTKIADLNRTLRSLHGPTGCLSSAVSRLVPFPSEIAAPADASMLDISVKLDPDQSRALVATTIRLRLSTRLSCDDAAAFFAQQFATLGLGKTTDLQTKSFSGVLHRGDATTHYSAQIARAPDGATITIDTVADAADIEVCGDVANWHGWDLTAATARLTSTQLFTIATGSTSAPRAIYDSHYTLPGVSAAELRAQVDERLAALHWQAEERYVDILEVSTPYDIEICINGAGNSSELTLLGEFSLDHTVTAPPS